jgi:hypothetical protein
MITMLGVKFQGFQCHRSLASHEALTTDLGDDVSVGSVLRDLVPTRQRISGDTSSNAAFSKALEWIHECTRNHPNCRQEVGSRLPARVLDIGSNESDVKLYQSVEDEKARYACLSYCWGDSEHIQTTRKTLNSHLQAIPFSSIPKVFRDVISFLHKLGLRYL